MFNKVHKTKNINLNIIKEMFRKKKKFPTLAVIILLFVLTWTLSDLGYLDVNIPWIPVILAIFALSWIIDRYIN